MRRNSDKGGETRGNYEAKREDPVKIMERERRQRM
jgi:hypothetical protein